MNSRVYNVSSNTRPTQGLVLDPRLKYCVVTLFDTIIELPDGNYKYDVIKFNEVPTLSELKSRVIEYYNSKCDEDIISKYVFQDMEVWLSSENQFNYKAAFDLAFQTQGATLPIKLKFGTVESPVYKVFNTLEELQEFYIGSITFITNTLNTYWEIKDNIDWTVYELTD